MQPTSRTPATISPPTCGPLDAPCSMQAAPLAACAPPLAARSPPLAARLPPPLQPLRRPAAARPAACTTQLLPALLSTALPCPAHFPSACAPPCLRAALLVACHPALPPMASLSVLTFDHEGRATRVVVLPTKLLRGMELQEAAEEEGEGEAEAVGEALAEGEAEVTITRGMGALVAGGVPEWRERAGTARRLDTPGSSVSAVLRDGHPQAGSRQVVNVHEVVLCKVQDVKGSEGDVGSVGKVVMHPLTHWVIDSGCTSHMTPQADLLDEVKPPGKIKFVAAAPGALLPVIGVGNAKVMGANGGLVRLGNVLLVEGLSANLLSVRRLQKSKAKVTFGPTSCRAKLGKLLLWDLEEKSSYIKDLWQLPIIPWNGKLSATAAAAATAKATAGAEETAPSDGALDAVKKVQQPQQPHGEVLAGVDATGAWAKASCGSGEANWETWHKRLCHVNFHMLQKLVKDGSLKGLEVKGAMKEIGSCPTCLETKFTKFPFSSGTRPAKASLTLVHMDVVGPTRAPSLSGSRYFLTIVESGHKVKVIRTDNGGEFISANFEAVLKKKGIQHQLTVPYNPQQNGVAERFNQTLQEGARTLLGRAGLPDPFWVTALWQVALVKNKMLATMGDKKWVPYTKCQQLTVSRDVKFLESLHYKKWKQQQQKLPTTPLIIDADEVQRPSRQVQVTVSDEEISRVTEDGGEPEVEEQQQQQDAPPRTQRPPDLPRRDVRPSNRLTYPSFGKPKVVRAGSVAEQCDEDEIAHCYWAAVPEPKTLAEALSGPDAEKWMQSVKEEYDSLLENETWELCELSPGKKAIYSKLIFRHKYGPDGELTRYKSRLLAKVFQQTKGKDFDEIFAPVGKGTTLRVMLGTAANRGWRIKQMDIKTSFLNGIILEELYMLQPEGLDDGSGRVCRLKKAIYGLKQAPRAWYHKMEETMLAGGFKKSECDHSLFLLQEKEQFLMLLVYVDDTLLFCESSAMIERVEEMLEMQFKCSKMGDVKYYLGMHVERDIDKGVLRSHKRKYCEGLAEKYGLQDGGKPATPLPLGFTVEPCADEEVVGESDRKLFHSMVGALNYAANHTRPDIAFATSRLASVVSRPSHEQLEAAKRLVRNVSATASVGLDFNSVKADGTSIGGYVCLFGGGAVSWRSKKQNDVRLSSCGPSSWVKEVVWLKRLLEEIGVCQREPTFSSPQPTPLSTSHSLLAPHSDESVEPSGQYPELVGCLMYLMMCTRPDLAYPLSLLARYMAPGRHQKVHLDAAKRVLRYLCSTSGMGLMLGGRGPVVLTGHADASW
ncbi:unnamed protein product, partial [Closterium sp. NIES-54]